MLPYFPIFSFAKMWQRNNIRIFPIQPLLFIHLFGWHFLRQLFLLNCLLVNSVKVTGHFVQLPCCILCLFIFINRVVAIDIATPVIVGLFNSFLGIFILINKVVAIDITTPVIVGLLNSFLGPFILSYINEVVKFAISFLVGLFHSIL